MLVRGGLTDGRLRCRVSSMTTPELVDVRAQHSAIVDPHIIHHVSDLFDDCTGNPFPTVTTVELGVNRVVSAEGSRFLEVVGRWHWCTYRRRTQKLETRADFAPEHDL